MSPTHARHPSVNLPTLVLTLGILFMSPAWAEARPGRQAAVATPEKHATAIAVATLEQGGNAVDAAVATAFALAVTLPDAGNIGGGGFMTVFMDGEAGFLDYRETAPALASRDMFLTETGEVHSTASVIGHRAVGTPGTVAGLWAAHQRHGKLPWAALVDPAVALARDGFVPEPWLQSLIEGELAHFRDTNFGRYYGHLRAGERFVQPELATTLERIAQQGRAGFYQGPVAEALAREMGRGGGLISAEDLAGYQPRWRAPLAQPWRDYRIVTAPLPSSGGFAISQYLRIRDLLGTPFIGLPHNSAQYVHIKAEIEKRIFADRAQYLGDPDYVDFDLQRLLSPQYVRARASDINLNAISPTEQVGAGLEGKHTTHFSILDGDGNAVSNTYTLNLDFGSGVVVEGAGFLLNNEMDDFSAAPGQPNYFGVVGDEANAIAPRKRMLSSMAPTLLLRDGRVAMVVGAMGGSTIFTTVYQTISNVIDYDMTAEQAVTVPRVHHQLLPKDLITYSPTTPLNREAQAELRAMGYTVQPHDWEFGNVQLITVSPDGVLEAAADPRFAGVSAIVILD